jgi:hypothetical protein
VRSRTLSQSVNLKKLWYFISNLVSVDYPYLLLGSLLVSFEIMSLASKLKLKGK